jgi:L-2-hydroxyglutarate oxidase LhgO
MTTNQPNLSTDYLIVGAGIIGLTIAYELLKQEPNAKIILIEKENQIGLHASGRNSGVLHSGVYYPPDSLKAKVCIEGSHLMKQYCNTYDLPIKQIGKVIVPTDDSDTATFNTIFQRATKNGAQIHLIDESELREIEPETRTATGYALWVPETAVIDSKAVMNHLLSNLLKQNVTIYYNCIHTQFDTRLKKLNTPFGTIAYGHLFNSAGLFADKIAQQCGLDDNYTMLPFKGLYYKLNKNSAINIKHLIYPIPDMNVPFLGIHFTKNISGDIYIGPSATPALGRENYQGTKGIKIDELINTMKCIGKQYYSNKQGFRDYAHQEIPRIFKSHFLKSAQSLVPKLKKTNLVANAKVGIRAQLYDKKKNELVMDFLISKTQNETHVLNAVSPAFTSAFSLAKLITSTQ